MVTKDIWAPAVTLLLAGRGSQLLPLTREDCSLIILSTLNSKLLRNTFKKVTNHIKASAIKIVTVTLILGISSLYLWFL